MREAQETERRVGAALSPTTSRTAGLFAIADELETFIHPEIEWKPGLMDLGKPTYRGRDEYRQLHR